MRNRSFIPLGLLLVVGALAGCGKTNNLGSPLDSGSSGSSAVQQAQVTDEVARQSQLVDDQILEGSDEEMQAPTGPGLAAIRPLFFFRHINHVSRSFEFAFSDTDSTGLPRRALVTIHKQLTGTFNLTVIDSTVPDSRHRVLIRKPLVEHWIRRVALQRVHINNVGDIRWRLVGTSGVKVTARDAATQIVSLRIQTGVLDTTIVNPLEIFRLRQVLQLGADAQVNLTVTTLRNDDVVVFYRLGDRFRMHNNGDNTYSATFQNGEFRGTRHLGVRAFSNDSIFDDAAPYDAQAWGLPFFQRGQLLGDWMP